MSNIIEINTDNYYNRTENDIYLCRQNIASIQTKGFESTVTIYVQAFNNIEKTKACLDNIFKFTKDINFDLLLIDNGSADGTFEYFKSLDYEMTTIVHITKNMGASMPYMFFSPDMYSRFLALVANDVIVTNNWLSNLIKVAESDKQIGMVNPMSSNVSNLQDPGIIFKDYLDMQKKAADFNISNPRKWYERLRLVTLGTLFKKECLMAIGLPMFDFGFAHNFGDDDITFRVRRSGYKAILAGDTWIHHDDTKKNLSYEQAKKVSDDLKIGREDFKEKYYGIDAWDDVNNYIPEYLSVLKPTDESDSPAILGIDVKCGTPILEIKNKLRQFDIFDAECYAYTTDAKYLIDLQTVCGTKNVFYGDINGFQDSFGTILFSHIVVGNDINSYSEPFRLIDSAIRMLKKGGKLFISLWNTFNIFTFLNMLGNTKTYNPNHAINYTVEEFLSRLIQKGYNANFISARNFDSINQALVDYATSCMKKLSVKDTTETVFRLLSEKYFFVITK